MPLDMTANANTTEVITSPLSKNLFQKAIHQSAGWSVLDTDIIQSNDHIKLSNLLSEDLLGINNDAAQVEDLKKRGINAEYINSSIDHKSIDIILDNCIYGKIKLLYISPERILSDLFQNLLTVQQKG